MKSTAELDMHLLDRPSSILKIKKAMQKMYPEEKLSVIATDPESIKELDTYCAHIGGELLEGQFEGRKYYYMVNKISQPGR